MSTKFIFKENISLKEIDGQAVLFSRKTGDFFGLNDTATILILDLVDSDFESTVAKSSVLFHVPAQEIRKDLTELIETLEQNKLLVRIVG